ncbi:MAG: peptidoglycan DD-metalloendopeptidase family protein [Syntrophomonadaceae bacterium]|nr:peptidoglycan DD-metalloendopeptidase family protein [Syntrophomonadaceae bacterium]
MKRKIAAFTVVFMLLFMSSASAYAVDINIDDMNVEFCGHTGIPFIDSNHRTQVPLRITMESLGAEVDWNQDTQTVVVKKDDIMVEVPIGKYYILKNGQQIPNDTVAAIRGGRTFIPIRAVLEAFGTEVGWEKETQTVTIDSQSFYGSDGKAPSAIVCLKSHPGDFTITTAENYPGNILGLKIEKLNEDDMVSIHTDAVKAKEKVFKYGDTFIAVLPIDLYAAVGDHDLTLTFNQGKDDEYSITKTFVIKSKTFKTQYLVVSESLNQSNRNDEANKEFVEVVKPARTISTPKKLWEGEFIMATSGRLTTDFAQIRYVNNEISSSRHSGIDLAAPSGTAVLAPNNGSVTLAAPGLLSTGNTIVIDHGMGLFTSYYHLNAMNVKVGDAVSKGDAIGTIGSTGFSTGPHLHYAVSIYNTYVNPHQPIAGIID